MKFQFLCLIALLLAKLNGQSTDSIAIKQVDSLIKVSRDLSAKKEFDKALEVNSAAEKIALEKLGKESSKYGLICFYRGRISSLKYDYPEAEKWFLESKAIWEKVLGKEHLNYVLSLMELANLYRTIGIWVKAEQHYLESKAILGKVLGKEHSKYALSLNGLGYLYLRMGHFEKAESLLLECIEIEEKVLGKDHPDYLDTQLNLGLLYSRMGKYENAESLLLECIEIGEKVLGKDHPTYAASLGNLAILYQTLGQYANAEKLQLECQAILGRVLGSEHPDYAICLLILGYLYMEMGQYEKAELFSLECKAIYEKTIGKQNFQYTAILNNLGLLYKIMGQYEKAETLYLECKDINRKVLGDEHPDFALILNNLANLYMDMGHYSKAESLYLESKAIREKSLGRDHFLYASSLNDLATLYLSIDQFEKAESFYLEAKTIHERILGKKHPYYADILYNLALLYKHIGQYKKAEQLFIKSKDIREEVLGREHPDYTLSLNNLADLYERQSEYLKAEHLLLEGLDHSLIQMMSATSFLSEKELAKYINKFKDLGNNLGAYIIFRKTNNTQLGVLPSLAYDHSLFYKGFLQTAASRLNVPNMIPPESTEMNLQLKGYRRRLAAEYTKPIAERGNVAELEEKANIIEKKLAKSVAGYADAIHQVKWQEVQKALKTDEAAIEFVNFQINFPRPSDSVMYAALLITSENPQPIFVPMFEEKVLTNKLSKTEESQSNELVAQIYTRGAVPLSQRGDQEGLYDLCWKPLDSLLSDIKKIYYSPAGILNQINFDAIPAGIGIKDRVLTLSDRYELVRLGSTRSIVLPDTIRRSVSDDIVLFGGIRYNLDTTNLVLDSIQIEKTQFSSGPGFEYAFRSLRSNGSDWNYLPGTEREILEISKIVKRSKFSRTFYRGEVATEESVKEIGRSKTSPRVLHFATHGFFFPNPEQKPNAGHLEAPVFKLSDNPMIRSGLIFSGGNYAWKTGKPYNEGREDGILTAYEISQMNLSNTELVVLSACETGLGDIKGNEGVYGLQRAFKIAGAKYLIMSLWQVPDKQTSLLMTTFYKKWLQEKMTIPDAFHAAQKQLREGGLEPYYWAGFVLVE